MKLRLQIMLAAALVTMAAARAAEMSPDLAKYEKSVDESVEKALAFLARNQLGPDKAGLAGSFNSPGMPGNTGVSSLCIMAFLAKGHTPGTGRYGDVINKGIDYVLSNQQADGVVEFNVAQSGDRGPMYSHCISTLMLAEVSGMVDPERQKKIDVVLPKALKLILDAQRVPKSPRDAGGWRYFPNSPDSDVSLTGWAVMALRAARLNGAAVPKQAIDDAVAYILKNRRGDGGFDYTPGYSNGVVVARTGLAVLCFELCGQHGHEAIKAGGDFILKNLPTSIKSDLGIGLFYYGVYYCSQGMFQLGGKYWEAWAARIYEILLGSQQPDGSWPAECGSSAYSTAMAVLAMGVVYQQLPIYQR